MGVHATSLPCARTRKMMKRWLLSGKGKELGELLDFCRTHECEKSAAYLENAGPDLFTAVQNSLHGKSTSQAERVMRTVNLRVDFGKWSEEGVLNAMKIRLAFYYNGYDPSRNMLKPK